MKILITTSSFDVGGSFALQHLIGLGWEIVLNPYGRKLNEAEVTQLLGSGFVGMIAGVEPLTRAVMSSASDLKIISRCGAGTDSVDLEAAAQSDIKVLNTPGAPTLAVAELAIGLMLSTLRHIPHTDRQIRSGVWNSMSGALLGQRTVGVVGYGRIGRRVGELVTAFGGKVIASDAFARPDDVTMLTLDEVLESSDIVSLHLPLDHTTRNLLDATKLAKMRKGAILINTSRGGLVVESHLADALQSGHLGGAAIDTFEEEPYSGPLAQIDNIVLTPHMGSRAQETRQLMEAEAADNLLAALRDLGLVP